LFDISRRLQSVADSLSVSKERIIGRRLVMQSHAKRLATPSVGSLVMRISLLQEDSTPMKSS
jgi:hypothetical protein